MIKHDAYPYLREAGAVRRYHTEPRLIGGQTDAEHQWNMAALLLAVWPNAPREVLVFALFHDVGERVVGDVPFPFKRAYPELYAQVAKAEAKVALDLTGLSTSRAFLDPFAVEVVGFLDVLEAAYFALDQRKMGAVQGDLVFSQCWSRLARLFDAPEAADLTLLYQKEVFNRLRDHTCSLVEQFRALGYGVCPTFDPATRTFNLPTIAYEAVANG